MSNNYDIFSGEDLRIADLIQRRRLQLLIHSKIYYELDMNLIADKTWDMWAKELKNLQSTYPNISEKVIWYDAFKDWDASTGAFLPLDDEWVCRKASMLVGRHFKPKVEIKKVEPIKQKQTKSNSMRLF